MNCVNIPASGVSAPAAKRLNSCGSCVVPFCVPGAARAVCDTDATSIADISGMGLSFSDS